MSQDRPPLLIAQLDPPHLFREGDWHYRTFVPGAALAEAPSVHVVNLDNIHRHKAQVLLRADVLILNSVVDPDLLPLLRTRRERRLVTVYEVSDDISAVQPWNPVYGFYQNRDNLHLFLRLVRACDAVQYSVPELQHLYRYLNPRGIVLRNQLQSIKELRPSDRPRDGFVIGWGGSRGHLEDVAAVAGGLIDWIQRRKGARLELMCADPIWRLFDRLPEARKRRTAPGAIGDYYAFVRGLDVGLAPLQDTAFNRSRSDVKFLEYAAAGVVPVVQRLIPYLEAVRDGENGFFFDDLGGMLRTLDRLEQDRGLLSRVSQKAHRYASQEREEAGHSAARLAFYRELLAEVGHAEGAATSLFHEVSGHRGAQVRGRHAILHPTRYEQLLHDGLVRSQQQQRPAEALAAFVAAIQLAPECYQGYLCLAATGLNRPGSAMGAGEALADALRRHPRSIQTLLALGMQHLTRQEPERAIERFLQAAEIEPAWEVPYLRIAQALREQGHREKEATRFEQKAVTLLRPLLCE